MNDNNDDIEFLDLDNSAPAADSGSTGSLDYTDSADSRVHAHNTDSAGSGNHTVKRSVNASSHSSSARARRRRRKRRKLLIQRLVFLAAFLVFIVSGVALVNILLSYHKASSIYKDVENAVFSADVTANKSTANASNDSSDSTSSADTASETTSTVTLLTNYDHSALLALNSDAVGYLQIPALDLLLPVVQGSDNSYYLSHTITGTSSSNGTLFIDCANTEGIESQNAIIYGHNMKNGSMFGSLKKYNSADFFNAGDNKYFYFYTGNVIYKYEIYSVHTTPAVSDTYTTKFADRDAFFTYINAMISASYYSCDLDFYSDSKTITFSTCTNDDSTRLVVQGLRIEEIAN